MMKTISAVVIIIPRSVGRRFCVIKSNPNFFPQTYRFVLKSLRYHFLGINVNFNVVKIQNNEPQRISGFSYLRLTEEPEGLRGILRFCC